MNRNGSAGAPLGVGSESSWPENLHTRSECQQRVRTANPQKYMCHSISLRNLENPNQPFLHARVSNLPWLKGGSGLSTGHSGLGGGLRLTVRSGRGDDIRKRLSEPLEQLVRRFLGGLSEGPQRCQQRAQRGASAGSLVVANGQGESAWRRTQQQCRALPPGLYRRHWRGRGRR